MVRLPDYRDGGAVGGVQSKRRGLSQGDLDSGAIGRGASKLGNAAASVGFDMKDDARALSAMRADALENKLILEHQRTYENDPNHEKYGETFDVASKAIREEAAALIPDAGIREKFLLQKSAKHEGIKDGIIRKGMELKDQAREVEVDGILEQNRARFIDPKATPEQRAQARADIDAHIQLSEQSGLLKPQAAARLKQKYTKQLAIDDVETRLLVEPDKVLEDFEFLGNGGVQGSSASELIKKFEGDKDSGWDYRQYSGPYGVKRGPNEKLTLAQAEARMNEKIASVQAEMDAKIKVPMSESQRAALTSLFYNIGTGKGRLDQAAKMINAGQFDKVPAWIMQYTRNADGGYMEGLDRRRREEARVFASEPAPDKFATQVADASGKVMRVGEDPAVAARKAELIKRYGALDPKQRLTVIKHAQTALTTGIEDAVERDIARIKAGIEPETDENGEAAIDRAQRLIGKSQSAKAEQLRLKYDAAIAERAAIAPLDEMDETAAEAHIDSLKSTPWLRKKAEDEWKKKLKLRDEDPATAVAADPDLQVAARIAMQRFSSAGLVVDQNGDISISAEASPEAQQQAQAAILRARLEAQEKRGIPEGMQRVITKREAKQLLGGAYPTGGRNSEWRQALEKAAETALTKYGPELGKRALQDAISFERRSRDDTTRSFENKLVAAIATGEGVTPADQRKYNELSRTTDMMSREFEMADPTAADDTRPYIGQPLQPAQQHIDWLKSNISDPASIAAFDAKFGQGAAARALYAGTETKTTKDLGVAKPAAPAKSMLQSLFGG